MNIAHSLPTHATSISFSFLSAQEIRSISVKQITNPVLLDNLNYPNPGGLYDEALGPFEKSSVCKTCDLGYFNCPGHFGHIELPVPVYHPLFMTQAFGLLRSVCLFCHRFKMPEQILRNFIARLQLLDHGLLSASQEAGNMHPHTRPTISHPTADDDEDEAQPDVTPAESMIDYAARLDAFVKQAIEESELAWVKQEGEQDGLKRKGEGRDGYKDGLVYAERKRLLHEFGRKVYAKCTNCSACAFTFRKEATVKIIEYDLSDKQKNQNRAVGIFKPNVMLVTKNQRAKKSRRRGGDESDSDEGIGGSINSDENDSDEEFEENVEAAIVQEDMIGNAQLPRAANGDVKTSRGKNERIMPVQEVREHLRRVFKNEPVVCSLIYGRHGSSVTGPGGRTAFDPPKASADIFFLEVLPVPPTRFRPASKFGDSLFENSQNTLLAAVLNTGNLIVKLNKQLAEQHRLQASKEVEADLEVLTIQEQQRIYTILLESIYKIQHDVNSFLDSSKNPTIMRGGMLPPQGVKQTLEKKEGLFRKHMMGKRVNYAARSVISPDINIETNEIGVPPVFAKKLTYPEPVTDANVHIMRQLVINGTKKYPGAAMVQMEDGIQISLDKKSLEERTAMANQLLTPSQAPTTRTSGPSTRTPGINKKVFRHLRDGDILLLNRQPTLHKASMMAHKAKILTGEKTIRMHYANCNSYNADFDGDEMNIHFPQNEAARAEAQLLANTDNQYLGPTSGGPLRGLIQDHVVAGVHMCNKSTFFTREQYFQIIYGALRTENNYTGNGRIITVPPTFWKPRAMWTGKQIINTILLNIKPRGYQGLNLFSKNKIPDNLWQRDDGSDKNMTEDKVEIVDGYLVRGVLDKSQYGASEYGLVHSVYEVYGAEPAGRLLGVLSRLFTKYLQHIAFTCRMDDLILTKAGELVRRQILKDASQDGANAAIKFVGLPEGSSIEDPETQLNLNIRLEEILRNDDLMGGLDVAMQGAFNKVTSKINDQIIPKQLVKPFPDNNMQTMTISGAKGSKVNATQISTLLGQQALEGRRVPTMVSGKTLPSFKAFDTAARAGGYVANRFLTGIRPQEYYFHCMAGREGLIDTAVKTSRSGYLQRCLIKHLEGVRVHYDHTVRDSDASVLQFFYGEDSLDVTKQKHMNQFEFLARNSFNLTVSSRLEDIEQKMDMELGKDAMKRAHRKPGKYPPGMSLFSPSRHLGSVSEKYANKVDEYISENPQKLLSGKSHEIPHGMTQGQQVKSKDFKALANVRYVRSLVDPGEAVGLLASQGVGEPSTQMTLNTFHLAGHGAANVTLGIPRLREIVMTASANPKTPTMTLMMDESVTEETIDRFVKDTSRLTLSQVVDKVTVTEKLSGKTIEQVDRRRTYTVLLDFYPTAEYKAEYNVTPQQIMNSLPSSFAVLLQKEITKEFKEAAKALANDINSVGKGRAFRDGAEEVEVEGERTGRDDELDDDGDAYEMKRKGQAQDVLGYESDEESETQMDEEDILAAQIEEDGDDEANKEDLAASRAALEKVAMEQRIEELGDLFRVASKYATSFSFDLKHGRSCQFDLEFSGNSQKLLLVDVVERCCRKAVIHEVSGIGRCAKMFDDKGQFMRQLITEGSNLPAMWQLATDISDINKIQSNDIYAILMTYGVEAARGSIIKELSSVFGAYGIAVDYRHLTVLADYMTQEGGFKPFNRTGIATKSSPLLKASFETTAAFLSEATLNGDFDDLRSPSAALVLGIPSKSGTGVFDVRTELLVDSQATAKEQ